MHCFYLLFFSYNSAIFLKNGSLKECIQNFLKHIIRTYSIEEIHRGVELHHINSASHDVFDVLTLVEQERLAAFTESFTQNLMFNIGSSFTLAIQTIVVCVVAMTESLLLWKDIPYPMALLSVCLQFSQSLGISKLLSIQET